MRKSLVVYALAMFSGICFGQVSSSRNPTVNLTPEQAYLLKHGLLSPSDVWAKGRYIRGRTAIPGLVGYRLFTVKGDEVTDPFAYVPGVDRASHDAISPAAFRSCQWLNSTLITAIVDGESFIRSQARGEAKGEMLPEKSKSKLENLLARMPIPASPARYIPGDRTIDVVGKPVRTQLRVHSVQEHVVGEKSRYMIFGSLDWFTDTVYTSAESRELTAAEDAIASEMKASRDSMADSSLIAERVTTARARYTKIKERIDQTAWARKPAQLVYAWTDDAKAQELRKGEEIYVLGGLKRVAMFVHGDPDSGIRYIGTESAIEVFPNALFTDPRQAEKFAPLATTYPSKLSSETAPATTTPKKSASGF